VSPPRIRAGQRTSTRILDGALELFERDGSAKVTTNHIAAHIGISPGNLYYWFSDKDQIIRALWARFDGEEAALWEGDDEIPGPDAVVSRLAAVPAHSRVYRFLARDLLALTHTDPVLRAAYLATRDRRLTLLSMLARSWRADGLIWPIDDDDLGDLVQALYLLAETWWPYAGLTSGPPDPADGERLLRALLEPYLAPAADAGLPTAVSDG
jgi:AcrR family transcriptional regulator